MTDRRPTKRANVKRKRKSLTRRSRLHRNLEAVDLRTEGLTLKQIGNLLDLSESRVCQILKRYS